MLAQKWGVRNHMGPCAGLGLLRRFSAWATPTTRNRLRWPHRQAVDCHRRGGTGRGTWLGRRGPRFSHFRLQRGIPGRQGENALPRFLPGARGHRHFGENHCTCTRSTRILELGRFPICDEQGNGGQRSVGGGPIPAGLRERKGGRGRNEKGKGKRKKKGEKVKRWGGLVSQGAPARGPALWATPRFAPFDGRAKRKGGGGETFAPHTPPAGTRGRLIGPPSLSTRDGSRLFSPSDRGTGGTRTRWGGGCRFHMDY